MGVPAFFRWLSRKYPSIVTNCNEDKPKDVDGVTVPVDTTLPNPNGVEFDNLYLDMNGIVHPCTHPEDRPAPKNEAEMMVAIFDALDRLFRIVRPRRLVFMAVDGVAPRAKMNQQRSRRFRAAKEAREKREEIEKIREELEAQGIPLPPGKKPEDHFDSNCITPGTPFMARLSNCLRYYIHDRVTNDPAWKNLIVILSDANVPGEGEHKIMDFIRHQRASPGHDPNTHHILCGADADLIMLGLATHEPYFTIIREEFIPYQQRPCDLCGQYGHELRQCQGLAKIKSGEYDEIADPVQKEKNYIFIRLTILREYLERELTIPNLPFPFDLERAIDDWVFMCFFVGNDFLPHLPSLEIREGAIDRLIKLYKECVYKTNGYLTENGFVNLTRVQLIMTELGDVEDEIFRVRQQNEVSRRKKEKDKKKRTKAMSMPASLLHEQWGPTPIGNRPGGAMNNARTVAYEMRMQQNYQKEPSPNLDAAKKLKSLMSTPQGSNNAIPEPNSDSDPRGIKRKYQEDSDEDEEEIPDEVRLWEAGWKERYYQSKFEVSASDIKFRYRVARSYVEGLCWVLRYYYQGCCDWGWYYPYHYAPFASDFVNLGDLKIAFAPKSKSITPLQQLMSVFPSASRSHVPDPFAELMIDLESPIIDFYPTDFKVDLNGKKMAWQGVALLPFVDAKRLEDTLTDVYEMLTDEEKERNGVGENAMFVSTAHDVYLFFKEIYDNPNENNDVTWVKMDGSLTKGVSGVGRRDKRVVLPGSIVKSPLECCPDLITNVVICVEYRDPEFPDKFVFLAKKLPGIKEPTPCLKPGNWNDSQERYRPMIGFSRDTPRASLSDAGRRFLRAGVGEYSNVSPPRFPRGQRMRYSNPDQRGSYDRPQAGYNGSFGGNQRFNGPPPVHYQQMMRHQRAAFNQQRPMAAADPNQYWQAPSRWPAPQQQPGPQRFSQGNDQQNQMRPSTGRPAAADYF